jgi:general secretion pathway protein G
MKRILRTRKSERGITLIEMMVVVVIIALFAALVGPRLLGVGDKAKPVAARAQIQNFGQALAQYHLATDSYPTTEQGLNALRARPEGMPQWDGPYLTGEIPLDPWSHPYLYKYPGEHGDEPDIVSLGADGQPGGEGNNKDIVSWSNK